MIFCIIMKFTHGEPRMIRSPSIADAMRDASEYMTAVAGHKILVDVDVKVEREHQYTGNKEQ